MQEQQQELAPVHVEHRHLTAIFEAGDLLDEIDMRIYRPHEEVRNAIKRARESVKEAEALLIGLHASRPHADRLDEGD